MHYDFGVTCQASLEAGADDVGTALRTILHAHARAGRRCVAFVGAKPEAGFTADCPVPVEFVVVTPSATPFFANTFDPALAFAQVLSDTVNAFLDRHSIACIEFPDRGAEGWFFIHLNLIHRRIPSVIVRIHGASWQIDDDNAVPSIHPPRALLYAAERETLLRADHLLCGGDALLSRTLAGFTSVEAAALGARCQKSFVPFLESPAPCAPKTPGAAYRVGCIGRLEYRHGADLLVLNAVQHLSHNPRSRLEIHVAGPDSATAGGLSFAAYLRQLVPAALANRFHFDSGLAPNGFSGRAGELDVVILPARFAHRPAALGAALATGRPVFVSLLGDLPEAAHGHAGIRAFNPLAKHAWPALFAELENQPPYHPGPTAPREPLPMDLGPYDRLPPQPKSVQPPVRLAIVIPHLNDAGNLSRLLDRLNDSPVRDRLEIIVVDDGSDPSTRERLETLRAGPAPFTLLDTEIARAGPFAARLAGTCAATADYVAYVDSDDYIEETNYLRYAQALAETPFLDVFVPAQRFFGGENDVCLFGLKAKFTLLASAFIYAGLVGRKTTLLAGFAHAARAADEIPHSEDWLLGASLLFTGAQIAAAPEIAYHYNRAMPASRSRTRGFMHWQTRAIIERHYERCIEEAVANGTMAPCELRMLRRLSITHMANNASEATAKGNRVPWHTHLFRAFRSARGDPRYRP